MASETLLLATRDNHVLALQLNYNNNAERQRKVLQYRQYCDSIEFDDFFNKYNNYADNPSLPTLTSLERQLFSEVDTQNTDFLEREFYHYDYHRCPHEFSNDMQTNNFPPAIANKANTVHFDNHINSDDIPDIIKTLGYKIRPTDKTYNVVYDDATQEYKINNFSKTRATVYNNPKRIEFVRNHFTFPPGDYQKLQQMIQSWQQTERSAPETDIYDFINRIPNNKDRALFKVYADEYHSVLHRNLSLGHELTHIKNEFLTKGAGLKKNAKRLSVENYYRLEVEDERSAYLSQLINATNVYLQKGNPNNMTMFDFEANILTEKLSQLPSEQRFAYVQDPKNLLDAAFKSFASNHRQNYDANQFGPNLEIQMQKTSLSLPEDTDGSEFKLLRSLYYRFKMYNPQTGRLEEKNLSTFITPSQEVQISQENRDNIITPNKNILTRRLAEYNRQVSRGEINPALAAEARALMRDNTHNPRFVNQIDGFEISSLYGNDTNTPPPIEQKPAAWSKQLKTYWQQADGYSEIANNQNEYTFKIKEGIIRYTDANKVQVSEDAEYKAYVKLLNEPSNKNKPVLFKDTLTEEQALKLYVACVNAGRKMKGAVPQDLTKLSRLKDIPAADLQRCVQTQSQNSEHSQMSIAQRRQMLATAGR